MILENRINSLIDVRNLRGLYIVQTVPFVTIRKGYISLRLIGKHIEEIFHQEEDFLGIKQKQAKLADEISRRIRQSDWNYTLSDYHARMLKMTQRDSESEFLRIFKMYYGPFFNNKEHDIPEIAKKMGISENKVYHELQMMDMEYFGLTGSKNMEYAGPLKRACDRKQH